MKAYGLPDHEWRDEYAPSTRNGHGSPMRSKPKRELRRIAKKQKRQRAEIEARAQYDDMEGED